MELFLCSLIAFVFLAFSGLFKGFLIVLFFRFLDKYFNKD